jgi:hypothetical protein
MDKNPESIRAWREDQRVLCQCCGIVLTGYWEDLDGITELADALVTRREYVDKTLDNPCVFILCNECCETKFFDVPLGTVMETSDGRLIELTEADAVTVN